MNSNNQTNRAVELRRARAQAKIEELSQRTKKQSYKPSPQIDIMSASWHSNASNPNKKDFTNLRTTASKVTAPKQQDLSATRTISSSLYHRSSSASSNPPEGRHDQQYAQMSKSTYSIDEVNKIVFIFNTNKSIMYLRIDVIHYVMMDKD